MAKENINNMAAHIEQEQDWGDPQDINEYDKKVDRRELLWALFVLVLYPICFGSGILAAHFFHW